MPVLDKDVFQLEISNVEAAKAFTEDDREALEQEVLKEMGYV